MSFARRLVHSLALVSPADGGGDPEDVADLDAYGDVVGGTTTTVALRGLVQPRTTEEVATMSQAGPEVGDHVIFLLRRDLAAGAHLVDADANGSPIAGGRRFEVVGVRDFAFGRSPHLEVDARLVGRSEAPLGS